LQEHPPGQLPHPFPAFLSFTILRIAKPTTINKTANTTAVPTESPLLIFYFVLSCDYFPYFIE